MGNREQEISTISRNLKALAKELNLPIIALSQLSRNVENRLGHKRPQLSDLRESGAIEQDADIVTFLYRPEYYKLDTWDDTEGSPTTNQAEFIIAKHRNGGLDNIRLQFVEGVFSNLSSLYSGQPLLEQGQLQLGLGQEQLQLWQGQVQSYSSKYNNQDQESYPMAVPKGDGERAFGGDKPDTSAVPF